MFINFHNQQKFEKTRYSKSVLVSVLEALETKNKNKIADLTAAFGETVAVDETLHLFSDKMTAMRLFSTFEAEAKPGPDPYMRDLDDEEKEDKEEQMKDQAEMDDDDPGAYKEMPGDEEAREKGEVKTSKHTKAYDKIYGDDEEANESVDVDRVVQIELEDGVYYVKPYGDSTHFYISTMKDNIGDGIPAHVGQHRSKPYYSDLRKYLKGGADIDGNSYIGESYVNEGKDDYMARYGKTDIMIKKGYKVADEGDLEDLYIKLGELANELGFGVKNITVVTEGKTTWQDVMEHIESIGEGDEQSDEMAYGQLERCVDYAKMIRDRYDQGFTFDSWMYGKITKAKDYLNTVFDAIDGDDGEIEESVVNEDLKAEVKKYIKKNQKDLDALADADNWDQIYNQLYTDFDVEPDSDDAQELKTVFTVTY